MSESIFSRLFHYREREKLSPRENYLTEMLAWMIDSLPQFGQDYVGFLCEKCKTNLITERNQLIVVSAQTQCSVTAGFIDMVIKTDKKLGFICEHKVDSPLSENQIQKYLDCHDEIDASLEFKTVLLTKSTEQHTQEANISITWHDVYEYFSDRINKGSYEAGEKIIIEQFLMYLTEVGMGMKESKEFSIESFKSYFKNVWSYFSQYIGLFDIDREDSKIICYLNRIDTVLHCKPLSSLEVWEQNACILFLKGMIYTLASYDIIMYEKGFYGDGVLFIPLPHHAGTSDCLEIKIDEFDEWFDKSCEGYKRTRTGKRISRIHWRLDE